MYEICIDSDLFKGKRLLQQHQMVNKVSEHPRVYMRSECVVCHTYDKST